MGNLGDWIKLCESAWSLKHEYVSNDDGSTGLAIYASRDGKTVGSLRYSDEDEHVTGVQVRSEYRRQGIATAMYDYLDNVVGFHVRPSDQLEPDGEKFWAARDRKPVVEVTDIPAYTEKHVQSIDRVLQLRFDKFRPILRKSSVGSFDIWSANEGGYYRFYAAEGDRAIGYVVLMQRENDCYQVTSAFITPQFQKRGIGYAIYRHILDVGVTLMSDWEQTAGSRSIWQRLTREPDVELLQCQNTHSKPEPIRDLQSVYGSDTLAVLRKKKAIRESRMIEPDWFSRAQRVDIADPKWDAAEFLNPDEFDWDWRLCLVPAGLIRPELQQEEESNARLADIRAWQGDRDFRELLMQHPPVAAISPTKGMMIADGNHRAHLALELGMTEVPMLLAIGEWEDYQA